MFRLLNHTLRSHPLQCTPRSLGTRFLATQRPFLLTDIGEGIQEVEILEWYVKEGDSIKEFDEICKVQSDKASVEITSRFEGIVRNVTKADIVKVGQPLLFVENTDQSGATTADEDQTTASPVSNLVANKDAQVEEQQTPSADVQRQHIVQMSPAVRKFAKDHSVDPSGLAGSGPNGIVRKKDILDDLSTQKQPFELIPMRGYNRIMFDSMTRSLQRPHMSLTDEILVDEVWKMNQQVSFLAVFLKAASCSLTEFPILNATSNEKNELMLWKDHNIGIAMDTAKGLVVPVIKGVQKLSMRDIQDRIRELKEKSPEFLPSDLQDATFTVSNIGSIAGLHAQAVLGGDAVAMGVLGRKEVIPVYVADKDVFEPKSRVLASWTADHRFVDGATLAKFHKHMRAQLENPRDWLQRLV